VRAILLDIEGTTTPLSFVHDVLFPYARARLAPFIRESWNAPAIRGIAAALAAAHAADLEQHLSDPAGHEPPPAWRAATDDEVRASVLAYCRWLMDRDRKSPALKELQGRIWDHGYEAGELRGVVFPDVPPAFRRWRAEGRTIAIFSSGSELAQRRLFSTTAHGDLTPFIARFFDTAVGAKVERDSYGRIASLLGMPAAEVCFVSDVVSELEAAGDAGMEVRLAVRPGNQPQHDAHSFAPIAVFDQL
jgi:enolase-phosphatase E1